MSDYHEPPQEMSDLVRDRTRALRSLREEVEAVDWYGQRVDLAADRHLARILRHNMEEEMEHAAMNLEWLRRNMEGWDEALRTYLFTQKDLLEVEDEAEEDEDAGGRSAGDLGIRGMKE